MAKIRCEYCDFYMDDFEEKCPNCGSPNANLQRVANKTPKTIDELKSWYIARKLPPEETTRFFIGKNIKEPRAFGIYEENGRFIVYKNKNDGSRSIRYEGKDEAYAVNELYLKLKEEILNQKNNNLRKKANRTSYSSTSRYSRKESNSKRTFKLVRFVIIIAILQMLAPIALMGFINSLDNFFPSSGEYYISKTDEIYYKTDCGHILSNHNWWKYDKDQKEWFIHELKEDQKFPDNVKGYDKYKDLFELIEKEKINTEIIDIYDSKNYIDAGHHTSPNTSYYYKDNKLYYFLDDNYSSYGDDNKNNTGWYIYNNNNWEYYCSESDKDTLGDLYYNEESYSAGKNLTDIYEYTDEISTDWNITGFETTSWYESYQANYDAYEKYQESHRSSSSYDDYDSGSSWDNDSDWDWDSSSDWDSGSTDWDSDW